MSFDIFDENYYLENNPDVARAVAADRIASGLAHFQQYGLREGRTSISPLYDEQIYLLLNPDVAASVNVGLLNSGLEHWILYGEAEGRPGRTGLYNEAAYLQRNPDVAAAVAAGVWPSGLEHFANFVLPNDATESRWDALFNEEYYLYRYRDVANAVQAGRQASGLAHFLQYGLPEGRDGAPYNAFNENFYLSTNPDVAAAVARGSLNSGLEHYARYGLTEGRSGSYFNEDLYRFGNRDVAAALARGVFDSGAEHFLKSGQYEQNRSSFFTGSRRNDIIRSFGSIPNLFGVSIESVDFLTGQLATGSVGTGEVDILITNGDNTDTVFLGNPTTGNVFYLGNGRDDFALIRDFDPSTDRLLLAGARGPYVQQVVGGSLNILYNRDLVAVVEGLANPLTFEGALPNAFYLGDGNA